MQMIGRSEFNTYKDLHGTRNLCALVEWRRFW